jgi:hypothetical protein
MLVAKANLLVFWPSVDTTGVVEMLSELSA